jgi:hypothetical protein
MNKEFILKTIESEKDLNLKDCELFFYYEFDDLKRFKDSLRNKMTIGEVKNKIYKEFGFMPSILMTLGLLSDYEKYFKSRFNIPGGILI